MPLRPEFSLINSEFNRFLHAVIADQDNGGQLTVMSALTRVGLDPWAESARLCKMPPDAAAASLARIILQLPAPAVPPERVEPIASQLVCLLPKRTTGA